MQEQITTMAGERTQLSKWWRTPSAQAAMRRVEDKRKEEARKTRDYFQAREAARAKELAEWKEVR